MYQQIVSPDLSAVGRLGWCLEYAFKVFKASHYEPSAWQAWTNTHLKHYDALPNVAVPMWYSYFANLDGTGVKNWGHVTINVPGQGIYSSPYAAATGHNVLSSIAEVEQKYGVKYVGWSEDILQELVIKKGDDMSYVGEIEFNDLFRAFFVDINLVTQDDRKRWVGAETNTVIRSMAADPRFINQPPAGVVPYSGPQLFVKQ